MKKYLVLLILPVFVVACVSGNYDIPTSVAAPPSIGEYEPTETPVINLSAPRSTATGAAIPDYMRTQNALQAEYLDLQRTAYVAEVTGEARGIAGQYALMTSQASARGTQDAAKLAQIQAETDRIGTLTALEVTQTQRPMAATETQAQIVIIAYWATRTRTAAEELRWQGYTETPQAQAARMTDIYITGLQATQTADAPLMAMRQRWELTEQANRTTATAARATEAHETQHYYISAGKWTVFVAIAGIAGAIGTALLYANARRLEKLWSAKAAAARQRVVETRAGPIVAGDNGAQAIANSMRPIMDMSYKPSGNSAQWAQPAEREPEPPVDVMRNKAGKLLLDACARQGGGQEGWQSQAIPRWDTLGWSSASEWTSATDWLVSCGAVVKVPRGGTHVSGHYQNIGEVYADLLSGALQPTHPTGAGVKN